MAARLMSGRREAREDNAAKRGVDIQVGASG